MTRTIPDAFRFCAIRAFSIDLPTRSWVSEYRQFPAIYVAYSFIGHFAPCVVSSLTSYCDNDALECKMAQGATIYAARASVINQDIFWRGTAGVLNRWASHKLSDEAIIGVKTVEAFSIALITGHTGMALLEATILGGAIGISEYTLDLGAARPIIEYSKNISQAVAEMDTNVKPSGAIVHDET